MLIEELKDEDLPQLINLMKNELGEKYTPKSIEFFRWKHYQNPFGKSLLFIAKEADKIVGLRAFLKWEFESSSNKYNTFRAVDTFTDAAYQGKGIFKNLTLRAVDCSIELKYDFVFNTPNKISKIGYIKMGWKLFGKMSIMVRVGSLLPSKFSPFFLNKIYKKYDCNEGINNLSEHWSCKSETKELSTKLSLSFLKWRYVDCPVQDYGSIITKGKFGIIFNLKKCGNFCELRICDLWIEDCNTIQLLWLAVKRLINDVKPIIVTISSNSANNIKILKKLNFIGPFNIGPNVTLRELNCNIISKLIAEKNFRPSLGTMELF